MKDQISKSFENSFIRTAWNETEEEWYFSVVDVVGVLTESPNPNNYWKVLKNRLKKEGSQLVTNCNQLKMQSSDGKFYKTDCMNTEQLLRLIQSIPSKKAEPFKIKKGSPAGRSSKNIKKKAQVRKRLLYDKRQDSRLTGRRSKDFLESCHLPAFCQKHI
jgi:hypothetical protein